MKWRSAQKRDKPYRVVKETRCNGKSYYTVIFQPKNIGTTACPKTNNNKGE